MGLNSTTGRESSNSEFHVSRIKQVHNLKQDATTGSVGTFDRIVVKNGLTLTLMNQHAMFLLTAEPVAKTPAVAFGCSVSDRINSPKAERMRASGTCQNRFCPQNQHCRCCSGFPDEAVAVIDINKMAFLLGKTPAKCAESRHPSEFPPSLIRATGIKLSKRDN